MIPPIDLRRLARARLQDAEVLRSAKRYDAAVYLAGYAVEIGLKARICRTLRWEGFPSTSGEFARYHSLQTHDLDVLLRLSGVEKRIKTAHKQPWKIVQVWTPAVRYRPAVETVASATEMIAAARTILGAL